mmetsp:Transcript_16218/g.34245  ORF Transcript_16218/g.34245 Transcript_16218/m.34245 type:complete len:244 (-) Transcript_16218:388-1119(-)
MVVANASSSSAVESSDKALGTVFPSCLEMSSPPDDLDLALVSGLSSWLSSVEVARQLALGALIVFRRGAKLPPFRFPPPSMASPPPVRPNNASTSASRSSPLASAVACLNMSILSQFFDAFSSISKLGGMPDDVVRRRLSWPSSDLSSRVRLNRLLSSSLLLPERRAGGFSFFSSPLSFMGGEDRRLRQNLLLSPRCVPEPVEAPRRISGSSNAAFVSVDESLIGDLSISTFSPSMNKLDLEP